MGEDSPIAGSGSMPILASFPVDFLLTNLVCALVMELSTYLNQTGKSPASFAAEIGVSATTVYRYILGDRTPRREVLQRILHQTGGLVRPDDFFSTPGAETHAPQ